MEKGEEGNDDIKIGGQLVGEKKSSMGSGSKQGDKYEGRGKYN